MIWFPGNVLLEDIKQFDNHEKERQKLYKLEKEIVEKTEIQQQSHAHRYTKILT